MGGLKSYKSNASRVGQARFNLQPTRSTKGTQLPIRVIEFFPFGCDRGSVRHNLRGYESEVARRPKGRITCNLGKND